MFKIYVALLLALSLSTLVQSFSSRRQSTSTQDNNVDKEGPRRYELKTQESRYDPRDQYPSNQRVQQEVVRPKTKYRRKPKQAYYPKVISFYQKPTTNNGYEFKYLTEDGVQRAERGYLSDKGVWTVEGSVTSLEGDVAVVQSYIADASGYKSSVRRFTPERYNSLDDFVPWETDDFSSDKMGHDVISSLVGG